MPNEKNTGPQINSPVTLNLFSVVNELNDLCWTRYVMYRSPRGVQMKRIDAFGESGR